jgi:hypothetical protein
MVRVRLRSGVPIARKLRANLERVSPKYDDLVAPSQAAKTRAKRNVKKFAWGVSMQSEGHGLASIAIRSPRGFSKLNFEIAISKRGPFDHEQVRHRSIRLLGFCRTRPPRPSLFLAIPKARDALERSGEVDRVAPQEGLAPTKPKSTYPTALLALRNLHPSIASSGSPLRRQLFYCKKKTDAQSPSKRIRQSR